MKQEILEKLLDYLQKNEDFALKHIPDVVLQAFRYEKISTYVTASLMIFLILTASAILFFTLIYPSYDKYNHRTLFSFMAPLISGLVLMPLFVQLCICIDTLIKMYVAPKYFLIQLIKNMLR